ncbi:MAG: hypothetical protein ACREIT_00590 [Tepidisphaeraceae bacterium]
MKYRVIGANRDSGARMVLEFEAESKAAAERKAGQQGMSVNRVEDVTDGHVAHIDAPRRRGGSGGLRVIAIVILIAVAAAVWWAWTNGWFRR